MYGSIVKAGVYKAPSIKVAEAAKVIENTQRDLNIALVNELSLIFHRIGIDTLEVLKAAGTKWNFLPFRPGLVGGHCIGVDPYYLTHKAEMLGYHPQVILAGRRINDGMGKYIAEQTVKCMINAGQHAQGRRRHRPRPDVQGELPRPAQLEGHRRHPRAAELRPDRCTSMIRWLRPAKALVEYGVELVDWDALPRGRRHRRRRFASLRCSSLPTEQLLAKLAPGGVYADVKCTADAAGAAGARSQRVASVTLPADLVAQLAARPRRWLVTGSAGFIGSHLLEALLRAGQDVTSVDNFATGHRSNLDEVRRAVGETAWERPSLRRGRHRRPEAVTAACEGVDIVLHQAALGSVPRSIVDPLGSTGRMPPAS